MPLLEVSLESISFPSLERLHRILNKFGSQREETFFKCNKLNIMSHRHRLHSQISALEKTDGIVRLRS